MAEVRCGIHADAGLFGTGHFGFHRLHLLKVGGGLAKVGVVDQGLLHQRVQLRIVEQPPPARGERLGDIGRATGLAGRALLLHEGGLRLGTLDHGVGGNLIVGAFRRGGAGGQQGRERQRRHRAGRLQTGTGPSLHA